MRTLLLTLNIWIHKNETTEKHIKLHNAVI